MALKDSFINLNKALRTTLQNVPAVVDTLIRGFDEIGDAAEEQSTYSTTEKVVGKWIDGSDIYEKTYYNANKWTVAANDVTTISDIDISNVSLMIDMKCSDGYAFWGYLANGRADNGKIRIINVRSTATTIQQLTIRYTKVAANRAPENDSKNVIDDEPVVKTVEDPEELKK